MTNSTKKITKRDNYSTIVAILDAAEAEGIALASGEITYDSLRDFVNHEVELLDTKAAAAQKRAAQKRAEGDELREHVYNALTNEFALVKDITKIVAETSDYKDVSDQMVIARLTQLIEAGRAEKDTVAVPASTEGGKGKKLSAYRKVD